MPLTTSTHMVRLTEVAQRVLGCSVCTRTGIPVSRQNVNFSDSPSGSALQELTREGKGNNLAMQLLYILKHTMHDTQAVGDREKLYFSALHAAFVKKYPGQEHDVVTWAKNYNLAASGQPLDLLSTISGKIVEWSGCAVQQPSTSQRSKPVAGADANSQYQLQHENQARSLL